jgi:hypothetical protein
MMRKLGITVLTFALGLVAAHAADFNGKWTADVPGRNGNTQTVNFNFTVSGSTLTGKVTTMRGDMDITNGKVDGDNISFDVVSNFNGNSMTQTYTGKADGDNIKFTRAMGGGAAAGGGGGGGGGGARPPVEFVAKKGSGTIAPPPQ